MEEIKNSPHRVCKFIEAMLLGVEIEQGERVYLIDGDNRIGYCEGEIFYEQDFSSFVRDLEGFSEKDYANIVMSLTLEKVRLKAED